MFHFFLDYISIYCGRRQGGVWAVVGLATCWLRPQAIHGLPPVNEAGLKAIKLECLQLKGRAGYHKPELGLAKYREDWIIKELDDPFPTLVVFTR